MLNHEQRKFSDRKSRSVRAQHWQAAGSMRVLVLGGWSPGPLNLLRHHFSAAQFEEPNIPMPPSGLKWCCNPFLLLLLLFVAVGLPQLPQIVSATNSWMLGIFALLASLLLLRLLVAALVRFSIWHACRIAEGVIASCQPDLVVGFSWGGGIAWQLCATGRWKGPCVLLAPTVGAMCSVTMQSVPLIRPDVAAQVHVFYARGDPFCPDSQSHLMESAGCIMHLHTDNHVMSARSTVSDLVQTVAQLERACADDGETCDLETTEQPLIHSLDAPCAQ